MDGSRALLPLLVCGLLATQASAQVTAIGPGTPGVTESLMTMVPTSTDGLYQPAFHSITPGSPVGDLSSAGIDFNPVTGCLVGGCGPTGDPNQFAMLDVSFKNPVSLVTAWQYAYEEEDEAIFAYSRTDQLVGMCVGYIASLATTPASTYSQPSGCFKVVSSGKVPALDSFTIANSSPNISTLLIGGYVGDDTLGVPAVAFAAGSSAGVPEPGADALLALALGAWSLRTMMSPRTRRAPQGT